MHPNHGACCGLVAENRAFAFPLTTEFAWSGWVAKLNAVGDLVLLCFENSLGCYKPGIHATYRGPVVWPREFPCQMSTAPNQ